MDSSFTIKPSPGVGKGRALRDPVPVREAIETELVGSKTVTAMGDGAAKDAGKTPNSGPTMPHMTWWPIPTAAM